MAAASKHAATASRIVLATNSLEDRLESEPLHILVEELTMPDRDVLLRSLEQIRARVGRLKNQLMELHNSVRFDHRLPGVMDRACSIQTELTKLAGAVGDFKENVTEERRPADAAAR